MIQLFSLSAIVVGSSIGSEILYGALIYSAFSRCTTEILYGALIKGVIKLQKVGLCIVFPGFPG